MSTASGVNCYLDGNHTQYLAQSLRSIVYVLENFRRTFANLVFLCHIVKHLSLMLRAKFNRKLLATFTV